MMINYRLVSGRFGHSTCYVIDLEEEKISPKSKTKIENSFARCCPDGEKSRNVKQIFHSAGNNAQHTRSCRSTDPTDNYGRR